MTSPHPTQQTPVRRFAGWALVVALLYFLILFALTVPAIMLAFAPKADWPTWAEAAKVYIAWPYWLWLLIMVISQAALLAIPVRVASRRPATRRSLWPTILAAGFMAGGLVLGGILSIYEFLSRGINLDDWMGWSMIAVGVLTWFLWTLVFFRMGRGTDPANLVSKQCRLLLKGSILELLIAVPTHIVARHRDYCCAGFMTFVGLTMGIAVMLFSFGPAVFLLFVERWKRLHPPQAGEMKGVALPPEPDQRLG